MPTNYPTSIDSYTTKIDGVSDVLAADTNNLQDAIVAIETRVGTTASPNFVSTTGNQTVAGIKTFSSNFGNVGGFPAYVCRAFVNFNANSGSPVVRNSANVSSITDNGVGDFTVNLTSAMPDANFTAVSSTSLDPALYNAVQLVRNSDTTATPLSSSSIRVCTGTSGGSAVNDPPYVQLLVMR